MSRTLAAVVLVLVLGLAPLLGQGPAPVPVGGVGPGEIAPSQAADRPPIPLVWAIAFGATALVLTIVCMPSRKG